MRGLTFTSDEKSDIISGSLLQSGQYFLVCPIFGYRNAWEEKVAILCNVRDAASFPFALVYLTVLQVEVIFVLLKLYLLLHDTKLA